MTKPMENDEMTTTTETSRMDALPESFEGARDQLAIEGDITNSSEWRRAAIVYALTEPKQGQRTDLTSGKTTRSFSVVGKIGFSALADWKVIGLKTPKQVSAYWHMWQAAIDAEVAEPVELGDPYVEPDMEWPGFSHYKGDSSKPEEEPKSPYDLADDYLATARNKAQGIIDASREVRDLPLPASDRTDLQRPTRNGLLSAVNRVNTEMEVLWEFLTTAPMEDLPESERAARGAGMTDVQAYAEILNRINEANESIETAIEIFTSRSGEVFTDDERRTMRMFLDDTQRVWAGSFLAAIDGGREAYSRYAEANQPQQDIYEEQYGKAVPATEKYAVEREKAEMAEARGMSPEYAWAKLVVQKGVQAAGAVFESQGLSHP